MPERIPEQVFISYCREDKAWLNLLRKQLTPLVTAGTVKLWIDDGEMEAGDLYLPEIVRAIDTSSAAVLLVSADFQDSEFIRAHELPRLLRAADTKELRLFWVPVGHCVLGDDLAKAYLTLGNPDQPLKELSEGAVERVLAQVARSLREHVERSMIDQKRRQAAALARLEAEEQTRREAEARPILSTAPTLSHNPVRSHNAPQAPVLKPQTLPQGPVLPAPAIPAPVLNKPPTVPEIPALPGPTIPAPLPVKPATLTKTPVLPVAKDPERIQVVKPVPHNKSILSIPKTIDPPVFRGRRRGRARQNWERAEANTAEGKRARSAAILIGLLFLAFETGGMVAFYNLLIASNLAEEGISRILILTTFIALAIGLPICSAAAVVRISIDRTLISWAIIGELFLLVPLGITVISWPILILPTMAIEALGFEPKTWQFWAYDIGLALMEIGAISLIILGVAKLRE